MSQKKKTKKHRVFWFIIKLQIVLMLLLVIGVFAANYGKYANKIKDFYDEAVHLVYKSDERTFIPSQTSVVYDADANVISYIKGEKEADYVRYEDIPGEFITAMVSIEDKKFYQHKGIDYMALLRSAKAIVESGSLSQGGSTITMQLARNIFLDNEKRLERKIKEMFIATELEKKYSKAQIMEFYLNNIYFANGYYGIQAACKGYFSCDLKDLSLSEVAFLCAIPNSPSYYDPLVNYENTIDRRDRILSNMYQDGKISNATYLDAIHEEIELDLSREVTAQRNNYVDTYVYYCATRTLMQMRGFEFKSYFASEEDEKAYYEAYDAMYADCQKEIYAEGYKIFTSIEMDKQEELQNTINEVLADYEDVKEDGVYNMQGAAVCIDNDTGHVVAIVGGREQDIGVYTLNRAYQSYRQPGSAIKPLIVYTPFFERGNSPETIVIDEAIEDGPKASHYYGEVTARFAVEKSLNSVAWKLYEALTPEVGLQYLKDMGFTKIEDRDMVTATALGGFTRGASPLEMTAAFATIQNDGVYREPSCIVKMIDGDKNVVYIADSEGKNIYGETASRMMTDVLVTAIHTGTGKSAALEGIPCAGKTGTTNDNKDGWFVGYTRYYTTGVWVGCDLPKEVEDLEGSTYPAWIWKDYMTKIHKRLKPLNFLPYAKLSDEFMEQYYPTESTEVETSDVQVDDMKPEEIEVEN